MGKVVLFVGTDCDPCEEVRRAVEAGQTVDKVEVVDIQTDEGWERFNRDVLSRGDGEVPSAYRDGQACEILLDTDDGTVIFDCPEPAAPQATPSPTAAP